MQTLRLKNNKWIFLIVLFALMFGLLFIYAYREHKKEIKSVMQTAATEEAFYMLKNLNDRLIFIAKDLLDIYENSLPARQSEYLRKTKHLIEANPFLQSINYIGTDQRIKFVSPLEPNKSAIGLKIEIEAPREAMEMAALTQKPYLSAPFETVQAGTSYSMMVPYFNGTFFEVVFKAEDVFGRGSSFRRRDDILIEVLDNSISVFKSPEYDNKQPQTAEYRTNAEGVLLNRLIHLNAIPTESILKKSAKFWRTLTVGSLFISFALLITIIIMQTLNTSRLRKMEGKLRAMSITDELTGLLNRRGFFTIAQHQLKTAHRAKNSVLLFFADLDNLKKINDTLGHEEGDLALIDAANILRETFRESDIIARIGGDEFSILLLNAFESAEGVIETRLQDNINAHNTKGKRNFKLSISMGVAYFDPENPCSIDELLTQADASMYKRKQRKTGISAA
jgi:diguanylate cyclase (GGDEF)-like protein